MATKLSAEQRVQKTHVGLMKDPKYCLYSGIFMVGTTSVEDDVPTACTNGRDTMYGRAFIDKLPDNKLRGLILHENLHKAFRHTTTWRHLYDEHKQLANMACDFVINLMIVDGDKGAGHVVLPDGGLLDFKYRNMDAGAVFRDLMQQARKGKVRVKTVDNQEGKDIPVEQDGGGGGFDDHDWDGAKEMTNEEKEQLAKDIDQALRQGAILAGKMSANVPREISDALESKVNWRDALREYVTSICAERDESTWRRPSRRWIGEDVYMPSLIGEAIGRIVVGIDTSGSIGIEEIGQFLGELKQICEIAKPEGIDLIYWDTEVCSHEKYERDDLDNLLSTTKPAGGGGTDPQCIPNYIRDHKLKPECAIILTDGYVGSWGEGWTCPTLWGITTERITSEIGKTIHVR